MNKTRDKMNQDKLDKLILSLIGEVLPFNKKNTSVDSGHSLTLDLGITSIGLMSLAFRIEEELDIDLMPYSDEYSQLQTVQELQTMIAGII
jgi:acyl carrier protein